MSKATRTLRQRGDAALVAYTVGLAVVSLLVIALGGGDFFWQETFATYVVLVPTVSFAACVGLMLATRGALFNWRTIAASAVFFGTIAVVNLLFLMKFK